MIVDMFEEIAVSCGAMTSYFLVDLYAKGRMGYVSQILMSASVSTMIVSCTPQLPDVHRFLLTGGLGVDVLA